VEIELDNPIVDFEILNRMSRDCNEALIASNAHVGLNYVYADGGMKVRAYLFLL
jgi:hypothetical protein